MINGFFIEIFPEWKEFKATANKTYTYAWPQVRVIENFAIVINNEGVTVDSELKQKSIIFILSFIIFCARTYFVLRHHFANFFDWNVGADDAK